MITLEINIPDNKATLLKAALGYQDKVEDGVDPETGEVILIDNPQNAKDYAEELLVNFLKTKVARYERQKAIQELVATDLGATTS